MSYSDSFSIIMIVLMILTIPVTFFAVIGLTGMMLGLQPSISPLYFLGYDVIVIVAAVVWFNS